MSATPFYQPFRGGKEKAVLATAEEVKKHFKGTAFPASVKLLMGAEVVTLEKYKSAEKPNADEQKALDEVLKKEDRVVKLRFKRDALDADVYIMVGTRDSQFKVVGYSLVGK